MFTTMASATLYVADQEKALKFYTEVLGFELFGDTPMAPNNRWIEVGPKGSQTHMVLYQMNPEDEMAAHYKSVVGHSQGIVFTVKDIAKLVADLKAKGVQFSQDLQVFPWGSFANLVDDQGNGIGLHEQTTPAQSV